MHTQLLLVYEGRPKMFATLSTLLPNQHEMSAIFSVVNFECPTWYCTATEQYVFSFHPFAECHWHAKNLYSYEVCSNNVRTFFI
jgi:hypothetical protein